MTTDWYPKAKRKLISGSVRSRGGSKPNMCVAHIAVSNVDSLYSYFSRSKTPSTFYVQLDGDVEQYLPVSSKPSSDYEGNHRTVSIEFAGGVSFTKDKTYTDAQLEAFAQILAWLHTEWDIPLRLAPNSKASSSGVAGHRWGINGNFPDHELYGGRTERGGGEVWSKAYGKTCPENYSRPSSERSRLAQIPGVISRAIELVGGAEEVGNFTPVEKPSYSWTKLSVDGVWGKMVTSNLQVDLASGIVDGEVSDQPIAMRDLNPGLDSGWDWDRSLAKGSLVMRALQEWLNLFADQLGFDRLDETGWIDVLTIKALQDVLRAIGEYSGITDGILDYESLTVKALQRASNKRLIGKTPAELGLTGSKPTTPTPKEVTVQVKLARLDLSNAQNTPVKGDDVGRLQALLIADGESPSGLVGSDGRPDKVAGKSTKAALGRSQVRHNTGDGKGHADYIAGEGTWTALLEA